MLRYSETTEGEKSERLLFPYRACLKVLLEVKSINFIEFAFAIYTLYDSSDRSIQEAVKNILYLRKNYPNLNITSEVNKKHVLFEINEYFGTSFKEADVWSKKTTINNQFIYFRDHLSLFSDFVEVDSKLVAIKDKCEHKGHHILATDNKLEYEKDINKRLLNYIS